MAKIIKLNENDLKRIVTKVLNERRLNEEDEVINDLPQGAITQEVADQLKYTENEEHPEDRFEAICNVCTSGKDGLGPLTQSEEALSGIAQSIYQGTEDNDNWLGIGWSTNEKKIASGIRNTKSFPDFCYMISIYSDRYENFFDSIDGEFRDKQDERLYLLSPVTDVINYSKKLIGKKSEETVKTDDKDKKVVGGGGEEEKDNWNMYMCVIEHPDAIPEKFADGKRTRFRIGTDYYMGNGKKIRKGVELDYSCSDKEFRGISFADKDDERPSKGTKRPIDSEVMNIQGFLTDEGYDISEDGKIGPETSGAILDYIVDNNSDEFKPSSVIELQKKMNSCYSMKIKEDGKVGPETLNAIADALESAQQGDLCS